MASTIRRIIMYKDGLVGFVDFYVAIIVQL